MTSTLEASAPTRPPNPSPSRWKRVALLAAAVALVAGAVTVLAATRDDRQPTGVVDTQGIAAVRQACQQWLDNTSTPSSFGTSRWCETMADWMAGQMADGRMMGPMMWGSPQAMRDTCRQWMATIPGAGTPASWCDDMSTWMGSHWDGWGGPMTGMMGGMMGGRSATTVPAAVAEADAVAIAEDNPNNASTWGYRPANIRIPAGATVTWRNTGSTVHSVTADDGTFDSGSLAPGAAWKRRFDTPGTFAYHCTPHPWMKAVLQVTSN